MPTLTKRQDFRGSSGLYNAAEDYSPFKGERPPKRRKQSRTGQISDFKDLLKSSILSTAEGTTKHLKAMTMWKRQAQSCHPTSTHRYLNDMKDDGRLLRCYTQNLDQLEERAGLKPAEDDSPGDVVHCHGSFGQLKCLNCESLSPWDAETEELTIKGEAPQCPHCIRRSADRAQAGKRPMEVGSLMPNIVLYGEDRRDTQQELLAECITSDLKQGPDLVLVIGTSLSTHSSEHILKDAAKSVHERSTPGHVVYVNLEGPKEKFKRMVDYHIEGDCEVWVADMKRASENPELSDYGSTEGPSDLMAPRIRGKITRYSSQVA